jgi:pyrrolidone-carboxylate peptidase
MLRKTISCFLVLFLLFGTLTAVGFAKGVEPPFKILLAGYGWYRGIPEGQTNNAETVALALDGEMIQACDEKGRVVALGRVYSIVMPVTWSGAWPPVAAAIEELEPDIVLGLGTGGSLTIEPYGSNVMDGCDANPEDPTQEECKEHEWIQPGGSEWRRGSLPYDAMVLACLRAGIPARRGKKTGYRTIDGVDYPTATPGWYLCNYFCYKGPWYVEENDLDIDIGFIHIWNRPEYRAWPRLEEVEACGNDQACIDYQMERSHSSSMSIDDTIRAIRISLEECVRARAQR